MSEGRTQSVSGCQIPYPDRYKLAVEYSSTLPDSALHNEAKLLLYALKQQADNGPCKEPKPWGWNVVESAKWQSWSQLGNMSQSEAMRLYVKTLDEEQPDWWMRAVDLPPNAGAAGEEDEEPGAAAGGPADAGSGSICISSAFKEGTWVVIQQDDTKKPLPRYEQGAAMLGSLLYVIGGHYGGRYLRDLWVYDLNKLQWAGVTPGAASQSQADLAGDAGDGASETSPLLEVEVMPAAAGHSVTPWQEQLLVLGGHTKSKNPAADMAVRLLDPASMTWTLLQPTGTAPCSRGGHTACLVGDLLYVYGGEDVKRRPLSDIWALDLGVMAWCKVEVGGGPKVPTPPARSGHVATVYKDKYLVVFGGGSIANCYNDTWVLDLDSCQWTRPSVFGPLPAPRAGHSAALVGDTLFVLGGGNNVRGCVDMLAADLSDIPVSNITWRRVCTVPAGSPLSSEGVSLMHVSHLQLLVAFGGYNGKYHNTVSVYKLPLTELQAPTDAAAAATSGTAGDQVQDGAAVRQGQQQQQEASGSPSKANGARLKGEEAAAVAAKQQQQQQSESESRGGLEVSSSGSALDSIGGGLLSNGSSGLMKELAVAREQLKRDLKLKEQELIEAQSAAAIEKEALTAENSLLRRQLAAAQASLADSEKALEDCRHALSAEQSHVLKLEAQLAEANEKLRTVAELEKALERYKKAEAEAAAKKGSGGLWGYISGGN